MLALIFFVMLFLPNSIEFGYKIDLMGLSVPVVYPLTVLFLICSLNRLISGFKQLPQIGFFLVYALLHTIITYPSLSNNSFLGLIKSYCPMIMILYVAGSWQNNFSFERLKKIAMIFVLITIPYYLTYVFFSISHNSGWGSRALLSGISGIPRILLPIGGPNIVGVILVLVFPLFLYDFTDTPGEKGKKLGRLSTIFGLIVLTFSRGSYVVLAVQSVILTWYSKRKQLLGWMMGFVVVAIIGSGLFTSRVFWAEKLSWKKIETGSTSLTLRAVTYNAMFNRILDDPFGSGIGKHFVNDHSVNSQHHQAGMVKLIEFDGRKIMYQSHSNWLLILVELGWIGGALFAWIFIEMIRRLYLAVKIAKYLNHQELVGQYRALIISVISFIPWLAISDSLFYNFRLAIVVWGILGCFMALAMKEIAEFQQDEKVLNALSSGANDSGRSIGISDIQTALNDQKAALRS